MKKTKPEFTLKILHDEDAPSPRENENLGIFAAWHRRHTLGDVQPKESSSDYEDALPENSLIVPVFMRDHSMVTLLVKDFGDPWDSGRVGTYHVSPARLIEEYGEDTPESREMALSLIKAEISEYSEYINGNCWGYQIEDDQGNHIDSCWGFIGSDVLENGLADNLEVKYLHLLEDAVEASDGATCDKIKLAEWRVRVDAEFAATVLDTKTPKVPKKSKGPGRL